MRILIAPNAFKNSLDAITVANAIGEGLAESKLDCALEYFPVGDGGDGTGTLIIQQQKGNIITVDVHDALGRKIKSSFGLIDDNKTAVIELADASGIRLLQQNELHPLHTTTFGTGELIKHALDKNINKIILCIGGSATVDGGTGILQALGIKFLNEQNKILEDLPASLKDLSSIDISGLDKRILDCELIILCDVDNKLLGENGAAKIFGPQKGASAKQVVELETILSKFSDITSYTTGKDMSVIKHGGAAGVAASLNVYCNAKLVNGINYFLSVTCFDAALQNADIVITGEGKIDEQTLSGKGPFGVAKKAKGKNIFVIGVAGIVPLKITTELKQYFDVLLSINNKTDDIDTAIENTKSNLIKTARLIGDMLSTGEIKI